MIDLQVNARSPDLAALERTLLRKLGPKAAKPMLENAAHRAVGIGEHLATLHLAGKIGISPTTIRQHIYFRSRKGAKFAKVAWSPTRRIDLRKFNPQQTATSA